MKLKWKHLVFVLLGILFTVILVWFSNSSCNKLSCLNIDIDEFKENQVYEDSPRVFRALYKSELGDMIRVEKKKIDKENQKTAIYSEVQKIRAYFENAISPYPGQISDEIECPENFIPELKTKDIGGVETNYFEVYLTERLAIGACSEDQAKNTEIIAWYYCENQGNLYQLEIISEKERFNQNKKYFYDILDSFSCK